MSEEKGQIPANKVSPSGQKGQALQEKRVDKKKDTSKKQSELSGRSGQSVQQSQSQELALQEQRDIDGVTIFCKICQDFIAHSSTTCCEHTFCEMCLQEYMLYIDQCPDCGGRIRNQRLSNNILLDNLILDYVKKYEPKQLSSYQERVEKFKQFQKSKKQIFIKYFRLNVIEAGIKVDVRDADYIWCTGRIYRTVNKFQDRKIKFMMVKYDKSNKKEQFPETSPRIAPEGFYTKRQDIPKYYKGKIILQNQQENVIYTLPDIYEDNDEKSSE